MVSWALAAPPVPTPADDRVVASVAVPRDIEALRASRRRMPRPGASACATSSSATSRRAGVGGFDDERGYLFVAAGLTPV